MSVRRRSAAVPRRTSKFTNDVPRARASCRRHAGFHRQLRDLHRGTYADPLNAPVTVDLLFSVKVSSDPFADQLLLSNGAQVESNNTVQQTVSGESIAQAVLREPSLRIIKGVVAKSNPAGVFTPTKVGPVGFNTPGTRGARFGATISSPGLAANPIDSNLINIDEGDLVTFAVVIENVGSGPRGAFDL